MAIDTDAKKASALSAITKGVYVVPSAMISEGDKQTISRLYSGILAGTLITAASLIYNKIWSLALRLTTFKKVW
jgi:hypothetical protein